MNLSKIIKHYRNCLSDLPDAPLYGNIPQGADRISEQLEQFWHLNINNFYYYVMGSFGDIELWSTEEILDRQYRVPKNLQRLYL